MFRALLVLFNVILLSVTVSADEVKTFKIYLDADRTNHYESARSMEMGLKTAFSEINYEMQGYKFEFVLLNHRGNSLRSKLHMSRFQKDNEALFILGGLHSPPLIKYRKFINENKTLILVPWAAGGPITRYPGKENWVFRLSVDDTKAGHRMARFAVEQKACNKPHLLLEKTPWGESNYKNMTNAFQSLLKVKPAVTWFNWNTKENGARIKIRNIISSDAECLLFVGNAIEGEKFFKALLAMDKKIPVISHWGITGGKFHHVINANMRQKIDLSFIQSCFSFVSSELNGFSQSVLNKAKKLFPEVKSKLDIPAPTGFIHAYDLGRLVITAAKNVKFGGNIDDNRKQLRWSLENIDQPVKGLIKTYTKPFSAYDGQNKDAHEALGLNDLCMGRYGDQNQVIVMKN